MSKYFELGLAEETSKITPLDAAIEKHIHPKMHIYSGYLPFALSNEIARQFRNKTPNFTISCLGAVDNINILIASGLVKRVIASYVGLILPSPVMSPVLQKALDEGLEIENWSLLTIIQRLEAAARNLPFMPTQSLKGSSIAEENENRQQYRTIVDPFTQKEFGVVKPLKPDLTIMHAYCADPSGNAIPILSPTEEALGAFASRNGVILSVEKIVSVDYIRRHSFLVKVPSRIVRAVVKAPFGMHPYGCRGHEWSGYSEDACFGRNLQIAFTEKQKMEKWLKKWVFAPKSHEDYLTKVGVGRVNALKRSACYTTWKSQKLKKVDQIQKNPPNKTERMAIFTANEIFDSIQKKGYDNILSGLGISHLASWIATHILRSEGIRVPLVVELGLFGLLPPPGQPFLVPIQGLEFCSMLTNTIDILGVIANNTNMLACLSAGQVDKQGNINSTKIGRVFLFGSGGANDVSMVAREVIVTVPHNELRLVKKVSYVTCPGSKVRKVVTDRGVLEKMHGELTLTKIYRKKKETKREAIAAIENNMGWEPKRAKQVIILKEPQTDLVLLLRCFDPYRYFLGKLSS
ncbi:MAG: hypothetical protein JSV05_02310 [Candidatus Bathyarchaeota archaeon]|nr:MAG: hypothetical protein JSV05_02310 [Candidatus Bathyarchaeota archaeon]